MTFPHQISKVAGQPASVRIGTVVSTRPLRVLVQDTVFQSAGILGPGSVGVGDVVALLGQSNSSSADTTSWLCLGFVSQGDLGVLPVASLRQTVAQSIPNAVVGVAVNFNVADIDTAGGWSSADPSRYFSRIPGISVYQCSGGGSFIANATGIRTVQFLRDGVALAGTGTSVPANAATSQRIASRTSHVILSEGEAVQLSIFQNSGAALNTAVVGVEQSTLEVRLVGRL